MHLFPLYIRVLYNIRNKRKMCVHHPHVALS